MSRLIDADANREDFKKIVCRTLNDCTITTKKKFNLIMTAFDNMPTAYDVDAVVAELEEAIKHVTLDGKDTGVEALHPIQTIKIVRKGGVDG